MMAPEGAIAARKRWPHWRCRTVWRWLQSLALNERGFREADDLFLDRVLHQLGLVVEVQLALEEAIQYRLAAFRACVVSRVRVRVRSFRRVFTVHIGLRISL